MLRKYYKQLLMILGILVALYIYTMDDKVSEPETSNISVATEMKPRGQNTILTDIIEVSAKHMLKLSRK